MMAVINDLSGADAKVVNDRAQSLVNQHQLEIWRSTDRLFVGLLIFEWLAGIVVACILSPRTWQGSISHIHPHVWQAIFLGFSIIAAPVYFGLARPGTTFTRHLIGICQMLSSALLIHLGNGRVEMHFHVFGSLAFLAFYRDWRVLISASAVVALDHLLRGLFFPESVFGIAASASQWRWLEHAGWVIFEDIFLLASCGRGVKEMRTIADRQALLEYSHRTVEEKVAERTRELKLVQEQLLKTARSAGMAEIATSVLHNVGNVLNSVNISVCTATSKVQESPVQNLALVVDSFNKHKDDLGGYLTTDAQGLQIPAYLASVSEIMSEEQKAILDEMASLAKYVEHIKQIVNVQQQYAKHSTELECVRLPDLLTDAINVNGLSSAGSPIEIVREDAELPDVMTDKHAVLQILINVIGNAKHAVSADHVALKRLILRTSTATIGNSEFVRVEVTDTGVGIEPANLTRIFTHGFTTKKNGHGFGLHSSANSAKQLRGSLTAHSAGPGTGATFTLELPLLTEVANHG